MFSPKRLIALSLATLLALVTLAAPAQAATVKVSTASGLQAAVKAAKPGTVISLAAGTYTLSGLELKANGTTAKPITLTGAGAVITTGSASKGSGLHVTGDYWVIKGVKVTKALKGIVADGASYLVIDGVTVTSIGQEGIHLRTSTAHAVVRNSVISSTGLTSKAYGEGIYVGSAESNWKSVMGSTSTADRSDHVLIENNRISSTPAEGIDVKEGTALGVIRGNVFTNVGTSGVNSADSWVDVKGNRYVVSGNSGTGTKLDGFQVHVVRTGWGAKNSFSGNSVKGAPGYSVRVDAKASGTVVACSSAAHGAAGLTNIACSK